MEHLSLHGIGMCTCIQYSNPNLWGKGIGLLIKGISQEFSDKKMNSCHPCHRSSDVCSLFFLLSYNKLKVYNI